MRLSVSSTSRGDDIFSLPPDFTFLLWGLFPSRPEENLKRQLWETKQCSWGTGETYQWWLPFLTLVSTVFSSFFAALFWFIYWQRIRLFKIMVPPWTIAFSLILFIYYLFFVWALGLPFAWSAVYGRKMAARCLLQIRPERRLQEMQKAENQHIRRPQRLVREH